jgi:hypothetical protein
MLDLNQLIAKQNDGNLALSTLGEDESVILQNYGYMATKALIQEAHKRGETVDNLVLNCFRNGICLGLGLQVFNGKIEERR